ncbi:MAG: TonB-dependent siderophore receptor [Gemmatimonadota bacterium]|nr:TonB-dependent siderophore receptor [Gemmatimonadota bacterium]
MGVDITASDGRTNPAPQLSPVRIIGKNGRGLGYLRFETATATKTPTLLRDIPQAVTVINRTLIRDQGMQGMADVVRYVPGITMGQGEGNRDQSTIRGNSTTADFFVNGVRDDAQYFRDLYNVERVEALKGSNAMIFGRGGGGGVINRVMKEAGWTPSGELTLQGGSYDNRRATLDVGRGLNSTIAARFNGVYENSDMFRDNVWLKRQGMNPTLSVASPSEKTRISLGYENFIDYRTADRGIPSFGNEPLHTDISTFFGNPSVNYSRVRVNGGSASMTHTTSSGLNLNNQTRFTSYDKIYQNVLPGAVSASGTDVSLSAYNNAHQRRNLFNQTDLTYAAHTGSVSHTLLLGAELGRQVTDNFRNTGYFNDTATTFIAPVASPTISTPVSFRQSATDADNHVTNTTGSIYTQDQVELTDHVQMVAGVRYENFGLRYHDNRSNSNLTRNDAMVSPRVGLLLKPVAAASLYANYSVSFLPSAGDQFSSLTDVTKALEPEKFENLEAGAKWDVANRISLTAALYRLDRSNTRAPDPKNPSLTLQTGSQRSSGYELGITGRVTPVWEIAGGFAKQNAVITSRTSAAASGTTVPLVPAATLSLWNKYHVAPRFSLALGVMHQTDMYAAISNTVKLPAFTRVDGGIYFSLTESVGAQLNLENIFNEKYYPLANGNNNITPGSPRSIRVLLTTGF